MVATGRGPTLGPVDAHLKALAEVSLAVARAEPALGDGALTATRAALDEAQRGLALLRESWPRMSGAERAVVGKAAAAVRQRLDATAGRVPASSALSRGRARARSRAGRRPGPGARAHRSTPRRLTVALRLGSGHRGRADLRSAVALDVLGR